MTISDGLSVMNDVVWELKICLKVLVSCTVIILSLCICRFYDILENSGRRKYENIFKSVQTHDGACSNLSFLIA